MSMFEIEKTPPRVQFTSDRQIEHRHGQRIGRPKHRHRNETHHGIHKRRKHRILW